MLCVFHCIVCVCVVVVVLFVDCDFVLLCSVFMYCLCFVLFVVFWCVLYVL